MARSSSAAEGSSPHTRGALKAKFTGLAHVRIIPAYAGSTGVVFGWGGVVEDHPRIRGEHITVRNHARLADGSSPHTRGAPGLDVETRAASRIIPAYAGSTHKGELSLHRERDHPRIRGEHRRVFQKHNYRAGSSPHTRGAPDPSVGLCPFLRIIPAYAGSTRGDLPGQSPVRDHPRIRGEHGVFGESGSGKSGSSPHTRGARTIGA